MTGPCVSDRALNFAECTLLLSSQISKDVSALYIFYSLVVVVNMCYEICYYDPSERGRLAKRLKKCGKAEDTTFSLSELYQL